MDVLDLGRECVWCEQKQCWVHRQVCRWRILTLGEENCRRCAQLSIWPKQSPPVRGPRKRLKGSPSSDPQEPKLSQKPVQLSFSWPQE
jgi:hypothetical protein